MAAPNIVSVTQLYGRTVSAILGTSASDILLNPSNSNRVYRVVSLYAANVDGVADFDLTLSFVNASPSQTARIAPTIRVPADATLVVVDKNAPIYLEEGDKITGLASGANKIEVVVSFEEIG